ncbi:DHX34 [Lepeophtheirus salmonis]|uniref:DHX34 n=1 Tax=Lepeophtheirus salmonis TaxID=72036 RepID=A0A7R8CVX1_LEPSM|nr:DHX34 [Lepeophtheirus salmonis]CAF2898032.1 DHX34 [Lepeophtheirus salmonis]
MTYKRRKSSDIRRERGSSRIFDFEKCRSKLCKIFFTERDLISRGSQDYDDFWKFLRSYQCFQEKKRREGKGMEDADPRSGISFDLQPSDPKDLLNRIPYQDPDDYNILTESMIKEFQYIVSLYVDFLQREKLKKLKKLKESQSNLPISGYRNEIIQSLVQKQVVIIAGDTGCGKSTQVPQFLLEAGYEKIACTQPRRLACIALANRVAYETLHQFGTETSIKTDPKLGSYNVVILDEVHERHLSGDFLLEAPIIQVPGRLYPIELRYFPIPDVEQGDGLNPAPYIRILRLIDQKYSKDDRGDVLIFLSGHKEIRIITDATKSYSEKNKVFNYAPQGARKCIISTNIAETSITIEGVRFVVDSGKVKEMHYDPYCKMRRLKEFWICNASAEQRKGRAGRTGPGFSVPEIQRVHLDSLVLQMISMGLPNARKFPFIEPPHPESLENAIITLKEQDAMNEDETLTVLGSMLSNLPVDVTIAGALSIQSPFTNDAYQNQECVAARKNLDSDHGDPITLLNSYREWLTLILTSGLYPQFAISDEFNNMKGSGADQLFHTKVKPFNVLHPNSYFSNNPEFISVDGLDIVSVPGFPSKYSVSAKHQILIYMSLLETTKSYIMNPLLVISFILRDSWNKLLKSKLESDRNDKHFQDDLKSDGFILGDDLVDFIHHSEMNFSIRRLLPGDIKVLYRPNNYEKVPESLVNPFVGEPKNK